MDRPVINEQRIRPSSVREQLRKTIELVGRGIRDGSTYFPIRQWAAASAAKAPPKNYLEQLRHLYADFTRRWRYVRDPLLAEMVHISGPAIWNNVFGAASGQGTGDCDCATAALGAAAASIGFPVRMVTSIPLVSRSGLPAHIYPEVFVKGINRWIPADPVVWPKHGFGYASPARSRQRWDLWGRPITGELAGVEENMLGEVDTGMQDYGLDRYGYAGFAQDGEPGAWGEEVGPIGFGAYADNYGLLGGFGMFAEVDTDQYGLARTPMIELSPRDWDFVRRTGRAYHGMCGLGDDGSVYQYDGLGGFFSKIFKGAKKLIGGVAKGSFKLAKGVGKAVWKGTKGILKKLPGGKYLVRFTEKIHRIAMKLVRPLAKIAGKLAKKIAPIAAMIPGYGPVISAALYAGGTIATEMSKHGVKQSPGGKLILPKDPRKVAAFKAALAKHAAAKRLEVKKATKEGKTTKEIVFGQKKVSPGHLPAGTPEHRAALARKGIRIPPKMPTAPATPAAAPAWAPPPEYWAEQQAEWAKEHAANAPQA